MKIYKIRIQRSNQIDDFIQIIYVVASSFIEVSKEYPNCLSIELFSNNIKIL